MRRYCLYCFATLPDGSDLCEQCRHASPHSARRHYWSLHPRHRQDEVALKVAIVLFVVAVGAVIVYFVGRGPATGPGAGWLIVLPMALGVALWGNAEKMTRHRSNFRPAVFWGALFGSCALLCAWVGMWGAAGLAAIAAVVIVALCRSASGWKRRIMTGESAP